MTGMEVWMRRSDRELKDMADIVAIAKRETVCTVAFHDESCPYLIPLNYGAEVEEGKLVLYFHGAKEGTKIDKIRENPQKKAFEENSFAEAMVNAVTVWKIVTENVTGKRHE